VNPLGWIAGELERLEDEGLRRHPATLSSPPGSEVVVGGRRVLQLCSNDYLGLAGDPRLRRAARAATLRWGAGTGASRLVSGTGEAHRALEAELARFKGCEDAIVFSSGYLANLGTIAALAGRGDAVFSDELNHASIVDGCRLSRARVAVYRHADPDHLDRLLAEVPARRRLVVTDTVFSMDGDVAPVNELAARCSARGALLVLDEAHAVLGPDPHLDGVDHLRVGTLSKHLGSVGGFVTGPRRFVDLLVNRARPFIFTTASPPADAAAALAALGVLRSGEGDELVARLRANVDVVAAGHPSPIVPVVLGDEDAAVAASAALRDRGLLVPAIRPPTVAPGTSRLRISLSATHTPEHLQLLLDALADAT
jgi:8-amino-7-oxononanoate synthase